MSTALIAGIDSVIGELIASSLLNDAWKVLGTSRRDETIKTKIGTVLNYHHKDVTLDQVTIKGSSATCVKSLIEQIVQAMSRGRHSVSILAQALVSFHMTEKKYEKKSIKVDTSFYLQCINFYFRSPS